MANKPQKELGGRNLSLGTKIIIIIFAVIMALSMMLPSLASFFSAGSEQSEQEQEAGEDATQDATSESTDAEGDESSDEQADDAAAEGDDASADDAKESEDGKAAEEAADGVPDNETLKSLAEQNAAKVERYEKRLAEDPNNLAALLNLGQTYMNWGYSATYSSTTDEESAYSHGLLDKAVDCFDRYLALNDSKAVRVDRALCKYYAGDTDGAIKALKKVADDNPDFPLAWANLGMLYETQYDTKKASEAYRKAVETDPDDEYGAYSYANQRLISLNATVSSPGDAGEAGAGSISTKTESGLTSTLATDSGVGF